MHTYKLLTFKLEIGMTTLYVNTFYSDGEDMLVLGDTANYEFRSNIARLQRQMFALLPKYCLSDNLFKQVMYLLLSSDVFNMVHNKSVVFAMHCVEHKFMLI